MKTNKEQKAQQTLIDNLKKQLANKRDSYNDMIYRAAILKIANEKIPVTNNNFDLLFI
jgi:hypothetical protein